MLKRINWKAILYGFLWVLSLGGLVTLMSFIEVKKDEITCQDIKVIIPEVDSFIHRDDIDEMIQSNSGTLIGRKLHNIDIHGIEEALKANPYIEDARVYSDMHGVINVQIRQREPVLRIMNLTNQDFYVDRNGFKMPISSNFTAHVLVANGFIMEPFANRVDTLRTKLARDLYRTAVFVENDSLWREQIEQLYVNQQNEIEMVPRVGNHKIILGAADSLETKFTNLLVFYKKAIPAVGWDAYKTINIKYINQVVGVKNVIDSTLLISKPKPAIATLTDTLNTIQDTVKTVTR
ncbi:cell division protein FtsQ/DivIB [Paradesertivirga mongoliensis]|uniref:Cell division protein FtsQ/DivIB n=1 Tax=Paradesertivirga mongoliensis TaxID=2100740 RepID=A0ABW4ZH33_9SPHI|nr:cell division protein FtsQ [Pedobacter mongoliensis]